MTNQSAKYKKLESFASYMPNEQAILDLNTRALCLRYLPVDKDSRALATLVCGDLAAQGRLDTANEIAGFYEVGVPERRRRESDGSHFSEIRKMAKERINKARLDENLDLYVANQDEAPGSIALDSTPNGGLASIITKTVDNIPKLLYDGKYEAVTLIVTEKVRGDYEGLTKALERVYTFDPEESKSNAVIIKHNPEKLADYLEALSDEALSFFGEGRAPVYLQLGRLLSSLDREDKANKIFDEAVTVAVSEYDFNTASHVKLEKGEIRGFTAFQEMQNLFGKNVKPFH